MPSLQHFLSLFDPTKRPFSSASARDYECRCALIPACFHVHPLFLVSGYSQPFLCMSGRRRSGRKGGSRVLSADGYFKAPQPPPPPQPYCIGLPEAFARRRSSLLSFARPFKILPRGGFLPPRNLFFFQASMALENPRFPFLSLPLSVHIFSGLTFYLFHCSDFLPSNFFFFSSNGLTGRDVSQESSPAPRIFFPMTGFLTRLSLTGLPTPNLSSDLFPSLVYPEQGALRHIAWQTFLNGKLHSPSPLVFLGRAFVSPGITALFFLSFRSLFPECHLP